VGVSAAGEPHTIESRFACEPGGAEALFRLSRAMERGERHAEDVCIEQSGQGSARWARLAGEPLRLPRHLKPLGPLVLWRVTDISEERGSAEQLRSAFETRLAHYDGLGLGLLLADRDGAGAYLNDRLSTWLGLSTDPRARPLR